MTMGFLEDGIDIDTKYVNQSYLIDNFPALISDKMFVTIAECGLNNYGQLGLNSTTHYSSFQQIPALTNIKHISGGYRHSFGLKIDGTLIACGYNGQGQLGINSTTASNYSSFQAVPSITNVKQIAGGYGHSLGLKTDGTLISAGYNSMGQLGLNNGNNYSSFQTVPSVTNIKQVACGYYHSLGLKTDGTLVSCGWGNYGAIGLNSTANYSSFQTIPSITNIKQIACGTHHSLGLKTDGTLIATGRNVHGQLGINSTTSSTYSSFQTVPSITNIKQISCGYGYSLGLKTDGTLIACGRNDYGQLGINSDTSSKYSSFQTIPSVANIKKIACGHYHSVGLKTDGTLISCGYNINGRLGLNSTTNKSSFQTVPAITNIKQIACGYGHTLLLKTPTNWL